MAMSVTSVVVLSVFTTAAAPDLSTLVFTDTAVERVATGFSFVEGPAWSPDGYLLFSDIPASRVLRFVGRNEVASVLSPSGKANGLVFDSGGNLYLCQGGARRVSKLSSDGKLEPLATAFNGRRFNSPNDLALDGAGGIYFTDPRYGSKDGMEQEVMAVYYIDRRGKVTRVIDDLIRPNGILVSLDGQQLYVAEPDLRQLRSYPIERAGVVGDAMVLFTGDAEIDGYGPDGMALDVLGNVYTTYRGVVVLTATGELVGRIDIPENPANCTFGGEELKTLFVTAQKSLYQVRMRVAGAQAVSFEMAKESQRPAPRFESVVIDAGVGIGYGVAAEDVNGDALTDVVLVDRDVVAWYRNPTWERQVVAQRLSAKDHVCIAVRDTDGDGRAEVAVGGEWNPRDTVTSGSLHYLHRGADASAPWSTVDLPAEPTVHRMRWIRREDGHMDLLVVPLHGRRNVGGEGLGVRTFLYERPADPRTPWGRTLVSWQLHMTHNLDPVQWDEDSAEEFVVAAREGLFLFDRTDGGWRRQQLAGGAEFSGASEVRVGRLASGRRFLASIEPFHGNQLVVYTPPAVAGGLWVRQVIDDGLNGGHAVACGDFIGAGGDQIVAGWRLPNADGEVGIRHYTPLDADGRRWHAAAIDRNTMACEDLRLADFDADGRLDLVAAGRATKNLTIYFNRSGR